MSNTQSEPNFMSDQPTFDALMRWGAELLFGHGLISEDIRDRARDAANELPGEIFDLLAEPLAYRDYKFDGVEHAKDYITKWFAKRPKNLPLKATLSATRTYTTNAGSVTFGMSGEFSTRSSNEVNAAYAHLLGQIGMAYDLWAREHSSRPVPNGTQTSQSGGQASSGSNSETLPLTMISKEFKNGKTQYRLHGGRWVKFGVALYPELMKENGDTEYFDNLKMGNHEVNGEFEVWLDNEKPRRVTWYKF